jgi:hypothetical protein
MRSWKKHLGRLVLAALIVLALVYACDWLVFRVRVAHGTAYGSVEVDQFLSTALKGNKTEYDMVGSFQQACSQSLFPHGGKPPCWWVRRHNTQWE